MEAPGYVTRPGPLGLCPSTAGTGHGGPGPRVRDGTKSPAPLLQAGSVLMAGAAGQDVAAALFSGDTVAPAQKHFTCTQSLVAHKAGISMLQATPHWLVSASADRVLKVWTLHVGGALFPRFCLTNGNSFLTFWTFVELAVPLHFVRP